MEGLAGGRDLNHAFTGCLTICFIFREYPCDHYTAIINVTLMNTGCPRNNIHETALQLLQILDKRFFSSFSPTLVPPSNEETAGGGGGGAGGGTDPPVTARDGFGKVDRGFVVSGGGIGGGVGGSNLGSHGQGT